MPALLSPVDTNDYIAAGSEWEVRGACAGQERERGAHARGASENASRDALHGPWAVARIIRGNYNKVSRLRINLEELKI